MDDQPVNRRIRASFGPDRRLTLATGAAAALAIGLAAWSDSAGRLLFAIAAALLAGYVCTDLVFSPRLVVDANGLRIRSPFTRADYTWSQVARVHADSRQRYGLRSVTLEIDADDDLVVLSRRALGADPEFVAELIAVFVPR